MRPADSVSARRRLLGGPRSLAALVVLVGVAILVAGCGGGSGLGVASITGSTRSVRHASASRLSGPGVVRVFGGAPSPAQRASADVAGLLFSRCMRAHGVPNFPDPPSASGGGGFGFAFGSGGLDPAAPLFRRAQRVCFSVLTHRGGIG
jgi:hypothetical protein